MYAIIGFSLGIGLSICLLYFGGNNAKYEINDEFLSYIVKKLDEINVKVQHISDRIDEIINNDKK